MNVPTTRAAGNFLPANDLTVTIIDLSAFVIVDFPQPEPDSEEETE